MNNVCNLSTTEYAHICFIALQDIKNLWDKVYYKKLDTKICTSFFFKLRAFLIASFNQCLVFDIGIGSALIILALVWCNMFYFERKSWFMDSSPFYSHLAYSHLAYSHLAYSDFIANCVTDSHCYNNLFNPNAM